MGHCFFINVICYLGGGENKGGWGNRGMGE